MSRLIIASVGRERIDRLLDVVRRAQQAELLAAEGDEDHASGPAASAASRSAISISIAAPDALSSAPLWTLPVLSRVEAAEPAEPEVIVVRADDQRLVPEHRVAAGQQADDVAALEPGHVRVLGHRRVARDRERLEPAARRRLQPDRLEPAREIGRRRVGARAAGQPAAEPVVAQEPDVVERERPAA